MRAISLEDKRILVTHADTFMGPPLCEVLAEFGAEVVPDVQSLIEPEAPARLIRSVGRIDVLVAALAFPAPYTRVTEVSEEEWRETFAHLVDPLPRLVRAVLPQMQERRSGKVLLVGSAAALRGMKRASTYSAARGAQLAFIQAVGIEMAPYNVQVNAIAQNFVDNPTYFPADVQANPAFQERLKREVPLGRLVTPREDAVLAAYLCSDAADCFVGQIFPMCGGWVGR
jgi:NAD(P)-dependent dehydrogenase (short-subunit alcohol dehydrogenase family)